VVASAFGVTGVGYLAVGLAPNLAVVAPGLMIGGAGLGLIVPNLVGWVAQGTPARLRGRLLGVMTSALFLGQFVSPVVWSPVVRAAGRQAALTAAAVLVGLLGAAVRCAAAAGC
jgi:MFS family permease